MTVPAPPAKTVVRWRHRPLISRIDWPSVEKRVAIEQIHREIHAPTISLFRWWARRPHAVIGALVDAVEEDAGRRIVIGDPFSGGGTVAVEAARRGLTVYAQDLHPWAAEGIAIALDRCHPDVLEKAAERLLERLERLRERLYGASCPWHGAGSEMTHVLWVRSADCPHCGARVYLYPYSLITKASRSSDEKWGFFGCSACGSVTRSRLEPELAERRCRSCHRRLKARDQSLTPHRKATCRGCGHDFSVLSEDLRASWQPCLIQWSCPDATEESIHFAAPDSSEGPASHRRVAIPAALLEGIPDGEETAVLKRAGFRRWVDLYPRRQLVSLIAAVKEIETMNDLPKVVRRRLLLAVCGAAEMAGLACRWDRYYPKVFEAIANHRFTYFGVACETNLLGLRGRGTLRRRLRASIRAARWADEHFPSSERPMFQSAAGRRRANMDRSIVVFGSSERLLAPAHSIGAVITDPPYFDDVQYGELASFYFAWARATGLSDGAGSPDLHSEAVPNGVRGTTAQDYERILKSIFKETARVLARNGILLITYHNSDARAWSGLAEALRHAGFRIGGLAVVASENGVDHSKRYARSFTKDLVLECRASDEPRGLQVVYSVDSQQDVELVAAGRAVADFCEGRVPEFIDALRHQLQSVRGEWISKGFNHGRK